MDDPDIHGPLRLELANLGQELDRRLGDRDLSAGIERTLRQRAATPRNRWLKSPRRRVAVVLIIGLVSLLATPLARAAMSGFHRIGAVTIEPAGTPAPTADATMHPPPPQPPSSALRASAIEPPSPPCAGTCPR